MMKKYALGIAALSLSFYALPGRVVGAAGGVDFRLVRKHFVTVPVFVNGEGPFNFLVDTGTNTTLVTPELAERLGLRPIERILLVTVAGSQAVPRAQLRSLALAERSVGGLEVLIDDLVEIRSLDARLCGVLGQNYLSQFNYTLDYGARRILFEEEDGEPPPGTRLAFEQEEGKLLVSATTSRGRPQTWRFVLDSAATTIVMFDSPARDRADSLELLEGAPVKVRTMTGDRMVSVARLRSLLICGEKFSDLPVVLVRAGEGGGRRTEAGLLPTALFRAIYFNHREKYVILNPRRGKARAFQ